jgi:eukaryotic-like serine/threonine-protein kinase
LGERLGAGGFGQVFAARAEDGSTAAAKLVPKAPGAQRELLFVELGDAPNIISVIDSGETADAWVLVMPMAERSLGQEIALSGAMAATEALAVLNDVAVALAGIEGLVVHRDLKPDNVLLYDGAWCLADFGISRYAEASTALDTRKFALSPPYAAPERWRAEHATTAADVYALGVIAHQLLAGELPFLGPSIEDFRDQHLHNEPPSLTGLPARLVALVEECLYKAPGARPTARNLQARLERAGIEQPLPGGSQLAAAYQAQVSRVAHHSGARSREQTEQERRASLAAASRRALQATSEALVEVLNQEAPGAAVQPQPHAESGWSVALGDARLALSGVASFDGRGWGDWSAPAFDVVSYATVSVRVPSSRTGYEGRSHSLYFCDAQQEGTYSWFETAFMVSPMMAAQGRQDPFALGPGTEAAKALWPGMAEYQVAWPFTALVVGDLDEFLDRWLGWFAKAAQGQLGHPSAMPERDVSGTWRRT